MELRKAVFSDWKAIGELDIAIFAETYSKNDYAQILKSVNNCNFVITNNELLVGYIFCIMRKDTDFKQTVAYISSLAVSKQYQQQGIASRLMNAAIESVQCLKTPVHIISLHVRYSNQKARCFYRKHKFGKMKSIKKYYIDPLEDAILMVRATCLPVISIT